LIGKIKSFFASLASAVKKAIDVRDVFVFGGLVSLSYGLWSFIPWVGWSVSGAVMMALGLGWLFRRPDK